MQPGGVEVWTARPEELGLGACAELAAVLDQEERERAARLLFDVDRQAFIVAHAMRRIALGLALAVDPQDLRFGSGAHGQPVLLAVHGGDLSFSLTRSRELVAFALCAGGPVGVDVETVRDGVEAALLEPYMVLRKRSEPMGIEDFYVHWTALEAFWKSRGLGLSTAHPRIELEETGESCFEVRLAGEAESSGLFAVRLPSPSTHVLSVVSRQVDSVRMVGLAQLAGTPSTDGQKPLSSCKDGHCLIAAASNIFSS